MHGKMFVCLLLASRLSAETNLHQLTEAALEAAVQQGGVIRFGLSGTIRLTKQLPVRGEVHLHANGNDVVISGAGAVPIFYITNSLFTATGVTFQDGVHLGANGYPATLRTNDASPSGGALQLRNSIAHLTNCVFLRNSAVARIPDGAWGGAISGDATSPRIVNCTFRNNSAQGGPPTDVFFPEFPGSAYSYAGGSASGGAVFISGPSYIADSVFDSNKINGQGEGGAVFSEAVPTYVTRTSFLNNSILAGPSHQGSYESFSTISVIGGAANVSTGDFRECIFSNNVVQIAANVRLLTYTRAGAVEARLLANFSGCTFVNNSALGGMGFSEGGAFHGSGGFTNCTFAQNHLQTDGGTYTIPGNPGFTWPTIPPSGGGLYLVSSSHIEFCTIVSNTLATGPNDFTAGGTPRLGGGIHITNGVLNLRGSILSGNVGSNLFGSVHDLGGNIISDKHPNFTTNSLVMTDPMLGPKRSDPLHDYFPLRPESPAIEFLSSFPSQLDQLDLSRPYGIAVDAGAVEFRGNDLQTYITAGGGTARVHLYQPASTAGLLEVTHDFASWQSLTNPLTLFPSKDAAFFRGKSQ